MIPVTYQLSWFNETTQKNMNLLVLPCVRIIVMISDSMKRRLLFWLDMVQLYGVVEEQDVWNWKEGKSLGEFWVIVLIWSRIRKCTVKWISLFNVLFWVKKKCLFLTGSRISFLVFIGWGATYSPTVSLSVFSFFHSFETCTLLKYVILYQWFNMN